MPLPKPRPGQDKDEFINSCMENTLMNEEYPDQKQRVAVCNSIWREKDKDMEEKAVLKIYGDIGESTGEMAVLMGGMETISSKEVSDFLDENKDASEIIVKINSRGGDVQEGWAIYDMLVNSGKKITTIGEGKVYSIATIVFLAGETRKIMQNADGQIHNPYIPEYTLANAYEAGDLEKIAESLRQEEAKILDFYVKQTGAEESVLASYMKEDTKLSAEDMIKLGFATEIVEPIKAFAYIKSQNKNEMTTDKELKTFGEKLDAIAKKVMGLSRVTPTDMVLKDAEGNEFTLNKKEGSPEVGDEASPDGTYVMDNGQTIIVTEGKVTEIKDPAPSELDEAKEKIAALESELAALKENAPDVEAQEKELQEKKEEAENLIGELKALKNDWKPEGRTKFSSAESKVDDVDLGQVKEIMKKKKSNN
jgi:ATP-dependent protease ClpP protease subunit